MTPRTVREVLDKPDGPVTLPRDGKWWADRETLGFDEDGMVTFIVGDGARTVRITGTPGGLRALAGTLRAQVDGAELNTP